MFLPAAGVCAEAEPEWSAGVKDEVGGASGGRGLMARDVSQLAARST